MQRLLLLLCSIYRKRKLKKPLDKFLKIWYNNYRKEELINSTNREKEFIMNMELLNYALTMLSERAGDARFWIEEQLAYDSALNIIVAALENKEEVLKEYDY